MNILDGQIVYVLGHISEATNIIGIKKLLLMKILRIETWNIHLLLK